MSNNVFSLLVTGRRRQSKWRVCFPRNPCVGCLVELWYKPSGGGSDIRLSLHHAVRNALSKITSPIHECSGPWRNSSQSGVSDLRPLASLLHCLAPLGWKQALSFFCFSGQQTQTNPKPLWFTLVHSSALKCVRRGASKQRIDRGVLRGSGMFWIWFSLILCFLCFLHSFPIPYHNLHMTSVWCLLLPVPLWFLLGLSDAP